jgi:hypothetical protein
MATKSMNDEDLIQVGDEDEEEVEIELEASEDDEQETNPNIADQIQGAQGSDTDEEGDKRTPEERFNAFKELDPEAADDYSTKVQKRIDKLTYKYHEEERQKQAALEFAENVKKENENLKKEQTKGQFAFLTSRKGHLESELEQAKSLYKQAYQANDPDLIADANQNISKFAAELSQLDNTINRLKTDPALRQAVVQTEQPVAQQPVQVPQQVRQQVEPDEKAQAWAEKNEWFGEDEEMTKGALAIHRQLVTSEGYLPQSDAYYKALDERIQRNYPDKFQTAQKPQQQFRQQVVAPGNGSISGSRSKGKTRVKLSASQVAIAKKLGVPLEEYAKYV